MELARFLKQRDVIYTLCAASVSTQLVIIADLLTTSIVVPIINNHKGDDIETFKVNVNGADIEIGKILVACIRFIIVVILLYMIFRLMY